MIAHSIERDPILVNNPYRDVLMNVEPLFELLRGYHVDEAFSYADIGIKYMALCEKPLWLDNDERESVLMFMYEMRDLFSAMKECRIALPKKGVKP